MPQAPSSHSRTRGAASISRAVTPIAFVQAICAGYARYGMDPAAALALAGIPVEAVADAAARITAGQLETLSETAMRELDDEALGWFSRRLPWGSYGMLCRASLTAPTLGLALKRWCRHHRLLIDDVTLAMTGDRRQVRLSITEHRPLGAMREFCLVTLLRYVHGFACWAVDSRIPLSGVTFPFARPQHAAVYPLMFPGPVTFEAAAAGFSCEPSYLELALVRDEQALNQMLERALPLTVLQYRHDRLLVRRARELLAARPDELRDARSLAMQLNVSSRTLHRQLRAAGLSLQSLKDDARHARAVDLLLRSQRPIKHIAHAVGFDNEKSFARAFRHWTGQSPSALRRQRKPR